MVRSSDMTQHNDTLEDTTELDVDLANVDDGDTEDGAGISAVYEIGYHLLPTLPEESLTEAVSNITNALKEAHADFIGERFPSKIGLAYPISKKIGGRKEHFDSAYFGWIAFEIPRASLESIQALFEAHTSVLRYLIVRTDRDAVAAAMTGAVATPGGDIGKPKREEEQGGEMSEKDLDVALKNIEDDIKTEE